MRFTTALAVLAIAGSAAAQAPTPRIGGNGPMPELAVTDTCGFQNQSAPKFHTGSKECVQGRWGHIHYNITALWYTFWKPLCMQKGYPFNDDAQCDDFEPIFQQLIKKNITTGYDDRWSGEFMPTFNKFVATANALNASLSSPTFTGNRTAVAANASNYYLRANQIGHLARYPYLIDDVRMNIYLEQMKSYINGTSFWEYPMEEYVIPHTHANTTAGDNTSIPILFRKSPYGAKNASKPAILLITGLDGYRPDMPTEIREYAYAQGWSILIVEMPGTGLSPAAKIDPLSPDRLWSSVLDWMVAQPEIDPKKIVAWGNSAGGYYGLRIAYTHADRLLGAIGQGAWSHYGLLPDWWDYTDVGEYPMDIKQGMTLKFGYPSVDAMKADAFQRFSLVNTGIVKQNHTNMLLVNGMDDTIFPIEDLIILTQYDHPKTIRFVANTIHMGEPGGVKNCNYWISTLVNGV